MRNVYVVEAHAEIVGARFSLESAQELADSLIDAAQRYGSREWVTDWRQGDDSTDWEDGTPVRTWTAHRLGTRSETYQGVHVREYQLPDEAFG